MQSVWTYGRFIARALLGGGFNPELSLKWAGRTADVSLQFVSASSGCAKTVARPNTPERRFGDDACFIARHRQADVIGVADGVGGWRSYGVDPSVFSSSLMSVCERLVKEGKFIAESPQRILATSYYELSQFKLPLIGSSTACIISLHREESKIYTCNLGDSGFLVVRDGKVVHRSSEQQHYFNTPFQLAMVPPHQHGLVLSDSPESAHSTSFPVKENDLIVLGTDGLFDNMHDAMILNQLERIRGATLECMQHAANNLVSEAIKLAHDETYLSPFAVSARAHGINITGGKPDDITVVLAKVTSGWTEPDDLV